jgi:hypothetical protein
VTRRLVAPPRVHCVHLLDFDSIPCGQTHELSVRGSQVTISAPQVEFRSHRLHSYVGLPCSCESWGTAPAAPATTRPVAWSPAWGVRLPCRCLVGVHQCQRIRVCATGPAEPLQGAWAPARRHHCADQERLQKTCAQIPSRSERGELCCAPDIGHGRDRTLARRVLCGCHCELASMPNKPDSYPQMPHARTLVMLPVHRMTRTLPKILRKYRTRTRRSRTRDHAESTTNSRTTATDHETQGSSTADSNTAVGTTRTREGMAERTTRSTRMPNAPASTRRKCFHCPCLVHALSEDVDVVNRVRDLSSQAYKLTTYMYVLCVCTMRSDPLLLAFQ